MKYSLFLLTAFLGFLCVNAVAAETGAAFRFDRLEPNATIGFYGDSLTQGVSMGRKEKGAGMSSLKDDMDPSFGQEFGGLYHQYIQLFLATRFPGQNIQTFNLGHSGGDASGGLARLEWDFIPNPPKITFLHFGMNDVKRGQYPAEDKQPSDEERTDEREAYRKNMTELAGKIADAGSLVVILSPTNYDDTALGKKIPAGGHLNEELGRFARIGRELAADKGYGFVDLHTPLTSITEEKQKENPKFSFTHDRVHPVTGGNEIMAYVILKDLGAPAVVYDVALSAEGKVAKAENADVTEVQAIESGLRFTLDEKALPFPVAKSDKGFGWVPFQEELNRQRLTVSGLPAGTYRLEIENVDVGEYEAGELADGIELAANDKTPQFQEAKGLHELIMRRKLVLEQRMAMVRNNIRFALKDLDKANYTSIDWNDPESMLASVERAIESGSAKGWSGFVMGTARYTLENYQKNVDELAAIRKRLAELPASRTFQYELVKE